MNYNVLIADDEYFIRQRLKKIILWEEWNLHFSCEAENGKEVLDLLETKNIDIVFLDIEMPILSGLETASYIKEHYPKIKVIILSGYNHFEYMRAAIRACTFDYLLKPIKQEDLKQVLSECVQSIKKESELQVKLDLKLHYDRCISLMKVRKKLMSYSDLIREYEELAPYKYSLFIGFYTQSTSNLSVLALKDLLSCLGMSCEFIQESEHIYMLQCFLLTKEPIATLGSHLIQFLEDMSDYIFISLNNIFEIEKDWNPFYENALKGLGQRFFSTSTLTVEHTLSSISKFSRPLTSVRENLIHLIQTQNKQQIADYIHDWFQKISDQKNPLFLQYFIHEVLLSFHLHYDVPKNLHESITDFCNSIIEEEHTLTSLETLLISYSEQCFDQYEVLPSDLILAQKTAHYIDDNYTLPNLSVASISEALNFNPSYLGTVFKNVHQISILQYITQIRMEHATKLLQSHSYLVSEVANLVGFSDVYYFSKRFKKIYGLSPKEYAQKSFS